MNNLTDTKIAKYQFEVSIKRSAADIWRLMVEKTDAWWMSDFRALGEDSKVTLNAETGGQLIESTPDGGSLEWYRVQMVVPGKSLYLVGYMAPDWGGPTISMLKLEIEERDHGATLMVSDALLGNVSETSADTAESGWRMLFNDGLKRLAER